MLIYKLHLLGWTQQEIADQVVNAGYEQEYSQMAVSKVLKLFLNLKKVLISQFEQGKPIPDMVKENMKSKDCLPKKAFRTFRTFRFLCNMKLTEGTFRTFR